MKRSGEQPGSSIMQIKHIDKVLQFSIEAFDKTPGTGLEQQAYGRSRQPRVHQATWEAPAPKQARLLPGSCLMGRAACGCSPVCCVAHISYMNTNSPATSSKKKKKKRVLTESKTKQVKIFFL